MVIKIIEATNGFNWGKFMLQKFDTEWSEQSAVDPGPLIQRLGWTNKHLWVLDLQTGEGAFFHPGGIASADLNKHRIWVCPMYEPFLEWVYRQDLSDITKLPSLVELTLEETAQHTAMYGYRRPGPAETPA